MRLSLSVSHWDSAKPATAAAPTMTNSTMKGARLFFRPLGDWARAASSRAIENRNCNNDADSVAVAAMMAARIESDIGSLNASTSGRSGGTGSG